jgi:AraC-like DNA-binding protein
MLLSFTPSAPALQPFIAGYADIFLPLPPGATYKARVIPLGCPTILLLDEGLIRITDATASQFVSRASFIGQRTHSGGSEYTGTTWGFMIQLAPAGAYDLLRRNISDFQNATVPLDHALGEKATALLLQKLSSATNLKARCAAADEFFLSYLPAQPTTVGSKAAECLTRSNGLMEIEDVAARLKVSVRTLSRRFTHEVGMSPKTFARLMRFRAAYTYLQDNHTTWADAVVRFGYTDQSHLIRDYRDFAGETPRKCRTGTRVIDQVFRPSASVFF